MPSLTIQILYDLSKPVRHTEREAEESDRSTTGPGLAPPYVQGVDAAAATWTKPVGRAAWTPACRRPHSHVAYVRSSRRTRLRHRLVRVSIHLVGWLVVGGRRGVKKTTHWYMSELVAFAWFSCSQFLTDPNRVGLLAAVAATMQQTRSV